MSNKPDTMDKGIKAGQIFLKEVPVVYNYTDCGTLPAGWSIRTLGETGQCLIGLTYKPTNLDSDGLLVLRSSNIGNGTLQFDNNVFVDLEVPERIIVREDDLLICVRNGSRPLIGKCALIDRRAVGMTFGAFMSVFRSPDNRFVFYCFQSDIVKHQIQEHLGATINQITNKSLSSFKIPYPSPEERDAIAKVLSDVDRLLEKLEALIAKKRAIKLASMQQLLTGKSRLPGFSGQWETKRLGEIAEIHRQNVVPAESGDLLFMHFSLPAYDEGKRPVIEHGSRIGSNKFEVPTNAVLVSKLNPRIPRVWAPAIIGPNSAASTEFMVFTPRESISRSFLYFLLSSPGFCEQMELLATGTTGSHQRVNPSDALKIDVLLTMDPGEQSTIANIFSDIDAEIVLLQRRRDKARAVKQGMMQQLLTGRVRLVEPTPTKEDPAC